MELLSVVTQTVSLRDSLETTLGQATQTNSLRGSLETTLGQATQTNSLRYTSFAQRKPEIIQRSCV